MTAKVITSFGAAKFAQPRADIADGMLTIEGDDGAVGHIPLDQISDVRVGQLSVIDTTASIVVLGAAVTASLLSSSSCRVRTTPAAGSNRLTRIMRLIGQIQITMATAEAVNREPGFWDKLKRGLGGKVNLDTGEVRVALEATALVDTIKRAFVRLGIDNAVSLVVDDTVIFQDSEGRPGDLPDLILALSEHASVFGRGFREMKLAVEHEEANLHLLCEVRAVTQHRRGEPSAYVSVGGRISDLEPRTGETAEAYRARVEPLAKDAGLLETARMQFQSFVGRLEAALHAALPRPPSRRSARTPSSCARRRSRPRPPRIRAASSTIRTPSTTRAR